MQGIIDPEENGFLIYDDRTKAIIEGKALVSLTESEAENHVQWIFPQIAGKLPEADPADGRGYWIDFTYEGMPEDNRYFGDDAVVRAYLDPYRSCLDTEPKENPVRVRFSRDGEGNPNGGAPNWFYYWSLTYAAQGLRAGEDFLFGGECTNPREGYISLGNYYGHVDGNLEEFFYICEGAQNKNRNSVIKRSTDGIDTFASILRHEWTHRTNYYRWWKEFYQQWRGNPRFPAEKWKVDRDVDFIPDRLEKKLGLNPRKHDTHHTGYDDEEYLAYKSEEKWTIGGADEEDWACPGKQCE